MTGSPEPRPSAVEPEAWDAELIEVVLGAAVWRWDAASDRVSCSQHTRDLLDLRTEVPGTLGLDDLLTWRDVADSRAIKRLLVEAIGAQPPAGRTLTPFRHEHSLPVRGERRRHQLIGIVSAGDPVGPPAVVVFELDVTDQFRSQAAAQHQLASAERELRVTQRQREAMGEYLAVLAHDLRAPLRQVASFADLVTRTWTDDVPERVLPMLAYLRAGAAEAADMVDDLLEFATVGAESLQVVPVPLGALVHTVWASTEHPEDAQLEAVELPEVDADHKGLRRVLVNVIGNAVKFRSTEPLVVRVAAARAGLTWRLTVTDNGIGMPAGQHAEAFALFRRLQSDRPGKGLGLAIAQQTVQAHGGEIWALPNPDGGTTVCISLPVADGAAI